MGGEDLKMKSLSRPEHMGQRRQIAAFARIYRKLNRGGNEGLGRGRNEKKKKKLESHLSKMGIAGRLGV